MQNDAESPVECSEEVYIGNDGCPVIVGSSPLSPKSNKESSLHSTGRSKNKSFVTSIKDVFSDDFHFEQTPEYANSYKRLVIDGIDVSSFSSKDIEAMSQEQAKSLLSQMRLEGHLRKKGFRGFKTWKRRYFRVFGNSLMYYEVSLISL